MSKSGSQHHSWKGDAVSVSGGRSRARRIFIDIGSCSVCGNTKAERHHKDENTANNSPGNIFILCRRCHMEKDGRLSKLKQGIVVNQKLGVDAAANIRKSITHCPKGHPYSGDNLYIDIKRKRRHCRQCWKQRLVGREASDVPAGEG